LKPTPNEQFDGLSSGAFSAATNSFIALASCFGAARWVASQRRTKQARVFWLNGAPNIGASKAVAFFIDALPGRDMRQVRRQSRWRRAARRISGQSRIKRAACYFSCSHAGCDQSRARDERVLILALIAADRPLECHKRRPLSRVGAVQNPEIAHLGVWACWALVDSSRATAQIP
jgi:hypothetical protein